MCRSCSLGKREIHGWNPEESAATEKATGSSNSFKGEDQGKLLTSVVDPDFTVFCCTVSLFMSRLYGRCCVQRKQNYRFILVKTWVKFSATNLLPWEERYSGDIFFFRWWRANCWLEGRALSTKPLNRRGRWQSGDGKSPNNRYLCNPISSVTRFLWPNRGSCGLVVSP